MRELRIAGLAVALGLIAPIVFSGSVEAAMPAGGVPYAVAKTAGDIDGMTLLACSCGGGGGGAKEGGRSQDQSGKGDAGAGDGGTGDQVFPE